MNKMKRYAIGALIGTSLLMTQPSFAQSESAILQAINATVTLINTSTTAILAYLNNTLPNYLADITQMATSWITTKDPHDIIANNQAVFGPLNQSYLSQSYSLSDYSGGMPKQLSIALSNTQQYLQSGADSSNPTMPANANDLTYTILLGQPLRTITGGNQAAALQTAADNYLKNISGANLLLKQANPYWRVSDASKAYNALYNTSAAIMSYDSYILANLGQQTTQDAMRANLTAQASNSDWFAYIQTENLGLVIRQLLMYTSQVYVQLDRLIKLQQQQLATQAMANTLLMINVGSSAGQSMYAQAQQQR